MAEKILTTHSKELLSAFSSSLEVVSERFLSAKLVEEEDTVFSEVRRPSRSTEENSIKLLNAIKKKVAVDNSHFKIVLGIVKSILPCEDEGCEWVKEMEEEYYDLVLAPPQPKRPRTQESPFCTPESELPEMKVIQDFWHKLFLAIRGCVMRVSDSCYSAQLITDEAYNNVLMTSCEDEKTRKLLVSVRDTISISRGCFEKFLKVLEETLLLEDRNELLSDMEKKYSKVKPSLGPEESDGSANIEVELIGDSEEVNVLRRFTTDLVTAISGCVAKVNDLCYQTGVISASLQKTILESKDLGSDNRARQLLAYVRRSVEGDERCFNLFLHVLGKVLLPVMKETLLPNIRDAYDKLCSSSSTSSAKGKCHGIQSSRTSDVIKSLTYSIEAITHSKSEIERLERELRLKQKENETLQVELEAMRRDNKKAIKELELRIEKRKSEIDELKKEIKKQEEIFDRHETKVKREQAVAEEERRVAKKAELEMTEKIQCLESEKAKFESEEAKFESEKAKFESEIKELESEVFRIKRDNRILSRRLSSNGLRASVTIFDWVFDFTSR